MVTIKSFIEGYIVCFILLSMFLIIVLLMYPIVMWDFVDVFNNVNKMLIVHSS